LKFISIICPIHRALPYAVAYALSGLGFMAESHMSIALGNALWKKPAGTHALKGQ
jgi:hypothetical protein